MAYKVEKKLMNYVGNTSVTFRNKFSGNQGMCKSKVKKSYNFNHKKKMYVIHRDLLFS